MKRVNDHDEKKQIEGKAKITKNVILIVLGILPSVLFGIIIVYYIIMSIVNPQALEYLPNVLNVGETSIVATAVSIWVGLNIYNFINKNEIDLLIKEYNKKLDDYKEKFAKLEGVLYRQRFTDALSKHKNQYVLYDYFIQCAQNEKNESSFYGVNYELLFEAQKMLNICTEEYEHDAWATMHVTAEKLYKYISDIENLYGISISSDEESLPQDILTVKPYLIMLVGDTVFYLNAGRAREGEKVSGPQLQESIKMFQKLDKLFSSATGNNITGEYKAYIKNTIGYTYRLLANATKDNMRQLEFNREAIKYGEECINCYENRGRYYRNTVLPYDSLVNKYNKYKKAYEQKKRDMSWNEYCADILDSSVLYPNEFKLNEQTQVSDNKYKTIFRQIVREGYKKAAEKDKRDYKAFNNIGALILKEIDIKYNINNRAQFSLSPSMATKRSQGKLLNEVFEGITAHDKEMMLKNIYVAKENLKVAMEIDPLFEDSRYNYAKACMYEGLLSNEDEPLHIARKELDKVLILNEKCVGAWYVTRNCYEAMQDIDNAAKWNQKIYPDNDSALLMGLYLETVLESMCKLSATGTVSEKVIKEKVEEYYGSRLLQDIRNTLEENMKNKYGEKSRTKE